MFAESEYTQFLPSDDRPSKNPKDRPHAETSHNGKAVDHNNLCTNFWRRLLSRDGRKFRKFVETTNTHGVRQIFIGKSLIRKIFWGSFFLFSLVVCLYNVSMSISFFVSTPTATTVTSMHVPTIRFPAVTICNMHLFRTTYLDQYNLTNLTRATLNLQIRNRTRVREEFQDQCVRYKSFIDTSITFEDALMEGGQRLEDFVVECEFLGIPCNLQADFTPVLTPVGRCYTFNARNAMERYKNVSGIGYRHGLELILNLQQDEFSGTFTREAGARVVVHNQEHPPSVLENGLAVPIGSTAYMSIRARQIDDRSQTGSSNCQDQDEAQEFEIVEGFDYSLAACLSDCIAKDIAEVCNCIHGVPVPGVGNFANYEKCSIVQLCCIAASLITTEDCGCTIACNQSLFDVTTTYSTYPALGELAELANIYNTTQEVIRNSFLSVRVFFSELIMVTEVTERSYSLTALVADIGGQFGLFLGLSIISLTEFLVWILDEFKDRCFGITESRVKNSIEEAISRRTSRAEMTNMADRDVDYGDRNGTVFVNDNDTSSAKQTKAADESERESTAM